MVLMQIDVHSIKALFALTLIVMVTPPCYGPSSNTLGFSGIVDASGFCDMSFFLRGRVVNPAPNLQLEDQRITFCLVFTLRPVRQG